MHFLGVSERGSLALKVACFCLLQIVCWIPIKLDLQVFDGVPGPAERDGVWPMIYWKYSLRRNLGTGWHQLHGERGGLGLPGWDRELSAAAGRAAEASIRPQSSRACPGAPQEACCSPPPGRVTADQWAELGVRNPGADSSSAPAE